jgi:putative ABC transport system permease protein
MNLIETIRIALNSLAANKLRSVLTMLGIIIGVGAVITLLALGGAIQTLVTRELQGLGSNLVFLFPGTNDPEQNRRVPPRLTNEDVAALADPLNVPAGRSGGAPVDPWCADCLFRRQFRRACRRGDAKLSAGA